jgi:WD40 repeat protein/uncharacterized caspase-like protein
MRRQIRVRGLFWAMLSWPSLTSGLAIGQPPVLDERPPEVWAIVVGIGDYQQPAIVDGQTSVRDAQAVHRGIRQAGWDRQHQLLLSDFGSADPGLPAGPAANILPTQHNLDWAFQQWIDKNAQAGDLVVFYFAGESRYVVNRQGTQLDVRHYLLPQDADPANIERTGWSLENAVDACVRKKLRVVCWLATAPEELRGPAQRAAEAPGLGEGWLAGVPWLARLARWPGVTAWLASDRPRPANPQAATPDPANVFTQALLNALGTSGPASQPRRKPNLAACLNDLHHDPRLERQGFRSLGGVPPSMTLWASEIGPKAAEPRPELVIQAGHADRVTAMAFPADGRMIVTAAMDSTVRIWSAPDRSLLRVLPGQMVGVTALALTRDDRWLITGGGGGAVLVHDRKKDFGAVLMEDRQPHDSAIQQIALLPDGLHFVSVDADGQSFLWDLSQSPLSPQPWPERGKWRKFACGGRTGPDGQDTGVVVALGEDGTVRTFNSSGRGGFELNLHRPDLSTMAVSPDGGRLALGFDNGQVVIRNLKTPAHEEYQAAALHAAVQRLVFSSTGLLAVGHKDGVYLIGLSPDPPIAGFPEAAKARRTFDLINRPAEDLVFSPGGNYLAVCTQEVGAVRVWRIAEDGSPVDVPALSDPSAEAHRLGFTGNGRGLVVTDVSGGLAFWPFDLQGDEVPWSFPAHRGKVQQLSVAPNRGCALQLLSSVNDVSGIPKEGKRLVIVAIVDQVLHFRIFDRDGKMIVDADAKHLTEHARPIDDLRKQLESLWPPHELTESEKVRVIAAVTSIVGHIPDRHLLLFLDEQRSARLWDLQERTCRRLRGTYRAGAFLDDDRLVLIPDSNAADHAGRLVLADRSGQPAGSDFFAVRSGKFAVPDGIPFERIAVSEDGQRIAAASDSGKEPMVCIWETKKGQLTHWITSKQLDDAVLALAFSGDGQYLLTGGDSPEARLWDLSARSGELDAPAVTFSDPLVKTNIICAAIRPKHPEQVVTGHSDGQIHVWKWEGGQARLEVPHLVAREFTTGVKALGFTSDGQHLAASGDGKRIWVGAMDPRPHRINVLDGFRPHHDEQISALIAWEGRPILVSGSDDTTIRLWDLEKKALRGTFSAANRSAVSDAAAIQELDWVLYTPEGLFDASAAATKLVHYRRPGLSHPIGQRDRNRDEEPGQFAVGLRRIDEAGQLDQLAATHYLFGLGENLLGGEIPGMKEKPREPAPISIRVPPRTDPTQSDIRLTITLGADDFREVRLYHNDVPIPTGWDDGPKRGKGAGPSSLDVPVKLVSGENRFYAMASQEGAYDSCSGVVEVDCEAKLERGQVHVLAIGVGDYQSRRLQYAVNDAEQLSEFLHSRGIDAKGQSGFRRVLSGEAVNQKSVERALHEITLLVEERPQDTVVVFLAGHTGVFNPQQFCLLLPSFPFPKDEPILVAARDAGPSVGENDTVDPQVVLPYSVIERNLARLKALNRLVIVDACQAESILYDPKVRAIRKWMELTSRRARTSYLMAARRGEIALEAGPLAHGLFTYALLRGMRAIELTQEPKEVKALTLPADADFNRDGIVSTDELDAYAKQVLPQLTSLFPRLASVARDAVEPRHAPAGNDPKAPEKPRLDQALRLQSTEVSFPLIPLNKP